MSSLLEITLPAVTSRFANLPDDIKRSDVLLKGRARSLMSDANIGHGYTPDSQRL